jgi:hypothetical protein
MVMVSKVKARVKDNGKDNVQDLVRSIVDTLWSYDSVRHVVNNNYIILQSIVRNVVKSLGINADNFDIEAFNDNFDVHELDTQSQDTLADSLAKLLSKFIIDKVDNDVDIAMEKAPYEIESRLREILNYLKSNPNDSEAVDYAKELIRELKEFNRELGVKYSRELSTILNPKPKVETEPMAKVRVIESKPEQPRPMVVERPKPVEPRTNVVRHNVGNERAKEIENIEYFLKMYIAYIRLPPSQSTPYYIEKAKELIDRLRRLNPQLASKYERELNTVLYEKRKYANYGKKAREPRARIRYASAKITEYFNEPENADNDNKPWKRHVKGILKWVMVIGLI